MLSTLIHCFARGYWLPGTLVALALVFFLTMGIILSIKDLQEHRLPNRLTGTLAAGGQILLIPAIAVLPADIGRSPSITTTLLAGLAYPAIMMVLHVLSRGGLGMGDVKLATGLGIYAGFLGWEALFASIWIAFLIGGVVAVFSILFRGTSKNSHIAFGPSMIAGTLIVLVLF